MLPSQKNFIYFFLGLICQWLVVYLLSVDAVSSAAPYYHCVSVCAEHLLQVGCLVNACGGMSGGMELSKRPNRQEGNILLLGVQAFEQMMCDPKWIVQRWCLQMAAA